jgi:hypothetical protein
MDHKLKDKTWKRFKLIVAMGAFVGAYNYISASLQED